MYNIFEHNSFQKSKQTNYLVTIISPLELFILKTIIMFFLMFKGCNHVIGLYRYIWKGRMRN